MRRLFAALGAAWAWLRSWRDWWPLALRSTLAGERTAAAEVEASLWLDIEAERRKVEVATDLLIAEKRRREMLSSTLDSLAIMKGFGPKADEVQTGA